MRILLDSNVLISSALFRGAAMDELIAVLKKHTIILTNIIIDESIGVIKKKFPNKVGDFKRFISELTFDYTFVAEASGADYDIRDSDDSKILYSAFASQADILITGDSDFFEKTYDGIQILKPSEFVRKYSKK